MHPVPRSLKYLSLTGDGAITGIALRTPRGLFLDEALLVGGMNASRAGARKLTRQFCTSRGPHHVALLGAAGTFHCLRPQQS